MESATQSYALYSTQATTHHQLPASSWHHNQQHVSGSSAALTSAYSGVPFSEYPSPTPSTTSPPFSHSEQYLSQSQPSPTLSNSGGLLPPLHLPQMESSIGPERTATRRPHRDNGPTGRLRRESTSFHRGGGEGSSLPSTSRRLSLDNPDDLSLQIGTSSSGLHSPGLHPMTPTSMSSPSFPSGSRGHLRMSSSTSAHNLRNASPAPSEGSMLPDMSDTPGAHRGGSHPYLSQDGQEGSPAAGESPRAKHKKRRLDNAQRKTICLYAKDHPNARQEDIAKVHGVERSTISKILKLKHKWLQMPDEVGNSTSKHRPSKSPELEQEMLNWVEEVSKKGDTLTDKSIREAGKEVARKLHIPEGKFKASSGWVENFKNRANIRAGVWQDAATAGRPPPPPPHADPHGSGSLLPYMTGLGTSRLSDAYYVPTGSSVGGGAGNHATSPSSPMGHDIHSATSLAAGLMPGTPWSTVAESSGVQPLTSMSAHHSLTHSPTSPRQDGPLSSRLVSPLSHQPMIPLDPTSRQPLEYYSEYNYRLRPTPTLSHAEDAIDTLVAFVDSIPGILTPDEREWIAQIKSAIYRYATSSFADRQRSS